MNQKFIEKNMKQLSLLSILLLPFSLIYTIVVFFRRLCSDIFSGNAYRSSIKVISIGNITTGGSGKTPLVLYFAKWLQDRNKNIAIVIRGYKSGFEGKNKLLLHSTFYLHESDAIGDEAIIYLKNLPNTPVVIGKNRTKSIQILENEFPDLDYIIMDDAFQHLSVKQDIKICVFNTMNPIGNGLCLPSGIMREPFGSLKHTDYFVLNGDKNILSKRFLNKLNKFNKPILTAEYYVSEIKDFYGHSYATDRLKDKKVLLLSGIGSPKSFENTISQVGITFDEHIALDDHYNYTDDFFINRRKKFVKYDYILTTEKDFSKLETIKTELPILVVYMKMMVFGEIEL